MICLILFVIMHASKWLAVVNMFSKQLGSGEIYQLLETRIFVEFVLKKKIENMAPSLVTQLIYFKYKRSASCKSV